MSKKIWLSLHLRNFDWKKSYVRPPLHIKWGESLRFKHPARFGVKSHSQPYFKKETKKTTTTTRLSLSFFRFFYRVGPVSEISLSLKILFNFRCVLIRGWACSPVPHILVFSNRDLGQRAEKFAIWALHFTPVIWMRAGRILAAWLASSCIACCVFHTISIPFTV